MHNPGFVGLVFPVVVSSALLIGPSIAQDARRDVGAHVHGQSVLRIAVEGNRVQMDFDAPGLDIVGFEQVPRTPQDQAAVAAAIDTLKRPLAIFDLGAEAGCTVGKADVEFNVEADTTAADAQAARSSATITQHTGFEALYELTCGNIAAIRQIKFLYFEKYPKAQEVRLELATPKGQTTITVPRATLTLSLAGKI